MTVNDAIAELQKAVSEGRGDQEFIVAIRTSEESWLEAKVDSVWYDNEEGYTAAIGEVKRDSFYSRGEKESESWRTWEDEL